MELQGLQPDLWPRLLSAVEILLIALAQTLAVRVDAQQSQAR